MVHGFGWDLRSCTCHKVPHKAFVAVVQLLSFVQLFVSPWTQHSRFPYPSLSPRVCSDPCPLKLMMPSNHLIPSPPAFNLSHHQGLLFQWVNSSQQVTKVLDLRFSISPSCEYSWFISFRTKPLLLVYLLLNSKRQGHVLYKRRVLHKSLAGFITSNTNRLQLK